VDDLDSDHRALSVNTEDGAQKGIEYIAEARRRHSTRSS
jgi:hypothetical protein